MNRPAPPPPDVPAAVLAVCTRLRESGHAGWIDGESLFALLRGRHPRAFEILTNASPDELLASFPSAVATRLRESTISLPTAAGPVDLTHARHPEPPAGDLRRRDFTVHAIAWDPVDENWIDPCGGLADLAAGCLRCPGRAVDVLGERPIRALRAARVVAETGLRCNAELLSALGGAAESLSGRPPLTARRELLRLLAAPGAADGLALLRASGVERALAPGASPVSAELLAAAGDDLALRLALWLRGAPASTFLRRFRFGMERSARVLHWLQQMPLERSADPERESSVRRLLQRVDDVDLARLFALRRVELAAAPPDADAEAAGRRLEQLHTAIEQVRGADRRREQIGELALDGRAVMDELGCAPGRRVGAALRDLAAFVQEDPSRNAPALLRERLRRWAEAHPE